MELVRLTTAGSVDDGKSTLVGRLLYDTKSIFEDQLRAVERASKVLGNQQLNLALFTDGLRAEREQGITIDVAYRYFATARRKFILADTPGHLQYTRNMVTGASTANLAVLLVDARQGIVQQTRRHGFVASLLRIPHFVLCVNKMDLVDWSQEVFERIRAQFEEFSEKLELSDVVYIPISALQGDNVVRVSSRMPWYTGRSLLQHLEEVHVASDLNRVDLRLPIQTALGNNHYAGCLASGTLRQGESVLSLPSNQVGRIKSISLGQRELREAEVPLSITVELEQPVDLQRGGQLVRPANVPQSSTNLDTLICWMNDTPLAPGRTFLLQHLTGRIPCVVEEVAYRIDIDTLHRTPDTSLALNDIGRVRLKTQEPLWFDSYRRNRTTGSLILIDPESLATAGAGMIR